MKPAALIAAGLIAWLATPEIAATGNFELAALSFAAATLGTLGGALVALSRLENHSKRESE